jgi:hypothetical protein
MANKPITITLLGFAGFVFACFTLFYNRGENKSAFHEIKYNPVVITKTILSGERQSIKASINAANSLKKITDPSLKDSVKKINPDSIIAFATSVLRKIDSLYFERHIDSNLKKSIEANLKSEIGLDSLFRFDTLFKKDKLLEEDSAYAGDSVYKAVKLNFLFNDPQLKRVTGSSRVALDIKKFNSDIDFFTQYPGFGIWSLLIIVFCCCLFITAGFCMHTGSELDQLTSSTLCKSKLRYWPALIICILLLAIFVGVTYLTFYDGETIRDLYFMKGLGNKIKLISILGYAAAAFCFAGMVSVAAFTTCFQNRAVGSPEQPAIQTALKARITELETKLQQEADETQKKDLQEQIQTHKKELEASFLITANAADYEKLRSLFRKFFYAIALLLALLTFCTGALYSASDSLDFMKMLKDDMGFSPARHDFVYLYAALHTLLILLFYLPAQLLFESNKPVPPPGVAATVQVGGLLGGLKTQWGKLTEVIVAGAPLVASFAQWLLNMIFEG